MNEEDQDLVRKVAKAFAIGEIREVTPLGGTATRKWSLLAGSRRLVVRTRPPAVSAAEAVAFDHEALRILSDVGLPVPIPLARPDGSTAIQVRDCAVEVLSWVEGALSLDPTPAICVSVGQTLARFHQATVGKTLPGSKSKAREDAPWLLRPALDALISRGSAASIAGFERVAVELDRVEALLAPTVYDSLPRAVIHGDFHPGNVRFCREKVSAIYDFDYLSPQARVRDLSDTVAFFCSHRTTPFLPDDIRSLTQPFIPDLDLCVAAFSAYGPGSLGEKEWLAIPRLLLSRWIQIRLRGSRKVSPEEQEDFILSRFNDVPDWLERHGDKFFARVRKESK